MSDDNTPLNEEQHQTARVAPVPPGTSEPTVPAEGTVAPADEETSDDLDELPQPDPEAGREDRPDGEDSPLVARALEARDNQERTHPDDPSGLSVDEVVEQVLRGQWGTGQERRNRLSQAGYDHTEVEEAVNEKRRERFGIQQ